MSVRIGNRDEAGILDGYDHASEDDATDENVRYFCS